MINEKDILWELKARRKATQKEFSNALKNKEWSKLAGYDGIDIGLMIAEQIIKSEVKRINA